MHFLLNWLWQGTIVALAAGAVLRVLRRLPATARYYIWWTALCLVVALPVIPSISNSPGGTLAVRDPGRFLPVVSVPDTSWASSSIAVLWCAWLALHLARLASALVALRRAQARSRPIPPAVETRLRHWGQIKVRGRRTQLVISDGVRSAAVLGVITPRIALAPALLEQLNDDDLDHVVAHEWAHVQRRDDLANLIQLLVRAIVGWHPAVWWIDRQLRFEREVACDDIAVRITGSPKAYAAGLAKLASLLPARVPVLSAPGVLSSSGLGKRIVRILAPGSKTLAGRTFVVATTATLALSAIACFVAGFELVQVAQPPLAAIAHTVRVPLTLARSESRPAPIMIGSQRTPGRVRPVSTRRISETGRLRTPAGATSTPPTVESTIVSHEAEQPLAVNLLPLSATALHVRVDQAHLPFARARLGFPVRDSDTALSPVEGARAPAPWSTAADAGVAVGRTSKNAAVATAGAFSRFGKKIASSF